MRALLMAKPHLPRRASTARLLAMGVVLLAACCAGRSPGRSATSPAGFSESRWRYEVAADVGAQELRVSAWLDGDTEPELTVTAGAESYVRDVEAFGPHGWFALEARKRSWFLPAAWHGECAVRYRVLLGDAARAQGDTAVARFSSGAIEAPPSTWLLRCKGPDRAWRNPIDRRTAMRPPTAARARDRR